MIRGSVDANLQARVGLSVRSPAGAEFDLEALIDTGFDDSLILPTATISVLGPNLLTNGRAVLADGSVKLFGIYDAEVEWDGVWRSVHVSAVGDEILLGMAMLMNHELRIVVRPAGSVEIIPLP
jgi:clan AA aspartic protease